MKVHSKMFGCFFRFTLPRHCKRKWPAALFSSKPESLPDSCLCTKLRE